MSLDQHRGLSGGEPDDGFQPRRIVVKVDSPAGVPAGQEHATPAAPIVRSSTDHPQPLVVPATASVAATPRHEDDTSPDIEATQQEIERTRAEMSATINAIQERLRPQRLIDEAKDAARDAAVNLIDDARDSVRDATIGKAEHLMDDMRHRARDTRAGFTETVRANPLPAAIAAASIGWLFMNRSHTGSSRTRYGSYSPYGGYRSDYTYGDRERRGEYRPDNGDRTRDYGREHEGGLGRVVEAAQERVGDLAEGTREKAARVAETASDVASAAGERVTDMAHDARHMATGAGSTVWDTISRNPVPAALVAVGLGWLLKSRDSDSDANYASGSRYGYDYRYGTGYGSTGSSSFADDAAPRSAYQRGYEVGDRIGDMAGGAVERVQNVGSAATHGVQRATTRLEDFVVERPLAAGAVALGIGAALGLAMPGTAREDAMFGEARETLVERAQDTAQEAAQRVARVAEQATSVVKEEARSEGLVQ